MSSSQRRPGLARPYSWTEGRTRPAVEIAVEAQVQAAVEWIPQPRSSPLWMVIGLCVQPCSVAEIAAHMSVPLGVAKVLVADLLRDGLVTVAATLGEDSSVDERRELIERVLSGLRAR